MNNTKRYNINTQVSFDSRENGLSYIPTKMDFITAFNKLLDEMENVAGEILRIISHAAFNQFIQGLISDGGGKFNDIVAESFKCRTSKEAITIKIESDFKSLSSDVAKIENCRDVHDFTQLNFEKDLKPQFTDLDMVKVWIERLTNWEKIIQQNIRTQYQQGLINIMGKGLRDTLLQKVTKEKANIRGYLYDLAVQKSKEITGALSKIKTDLGKPTHSLQTFVDYVNQLKLSKNQKENLNEERKRFEEMNMTLKKFRSKEDSVFSANLGLIGTKIEET